MNHSIVEPKLFPILKRMHLLKLFVTSLVLITCSYSSLATANDYAIEVVLFVNKDGLQQTAEQFSINHIIPVPSKGIDLNSESNNTDWQAITEENYILDDVVDRLKRSGRYRILKHLAWQQPRVDRDNALPIKITAGRDFTSLFPERAYRQIEFSDTSANDTQNYNQRVHELAGTINVVITRYIHVYTDLVYRLPRSNPSSLDDALNRDQVLVDYAVNSHRRMRSRELHYIDHPLVGILVEATPIDKE